MKSTYISHRHSHRTANVRVCMRDGRRRMRCAVVVVLLAVQCLEFCCQPPKQTSLDGKLSLSPSARKRGACCNARAGSKE